MAYAATADVQKYFLDFPFSATSKLKTADVDEMCDHDAAELDGILSAQTEYTVPITGTSALKVMKRLSALRVAASAWRRLHVTTQSDQATMADKWRDEADQLLELIISGAIRLGGAGVQAGVDASNAPRVASRTEIFSRDALDDFASAHGTDS